MSLPDELTRNIPAASVRDLLHRAARHDAVQPLSERFRMLLDSSGDALAVVSRAREVAGGAREEEVTAYGARLSDGTIELVVAPQQRRRGLGTAVLRELLRPGADPPDTVWAHGNLPAAQAFAARNGLVPIRRLHKMARTLTSSDATAAVDFPDGFTVRSFTPGDEDAWLALNAAAFASHPEQGRVDRADLTALMGQPWFDPDDLLLLWAPGGELAGSHWTKVDPAERVGSRPAGEVYVLAVAPAWHGHGLSGPLTTAGLRHLARIGLGAVVLYVDEDNAPARATYHRLGFETVTVDAQYAAG